MAGTAPYPGKLPLMQQLQAIIHQLGIGDASHVVIYDDEGGGWAGRFAWTLDLLGYPNWSYLNGGIVAWINEGFATHGVGNDTSRSVSPPLPAQVEIVNPSVLISADQIISQLGNPAFAVWDARSPGEYSGDIVRSTKGGHIPGAINIEWTALIGRPTQLAYSRRCRGHSKYSWPDPRQADNDSLPESPSLGIYLHGGANTGI